MRHLTAAVCIPLGAWVYADARSWWWVAATVVLWIAVAELAAWNWNTERERRRAR